MSSKKKIEEARDTVRVNAKEIQAHLDEVDQLMKDLYQKYLAGEVPEAAEMEFVASWPSIRELKEHITKGVQAL